MSDKYPGNLITGPSSGYSVYFNGVNSYLTFTKNLELTTDFTIEFWLYPVVQATAGMYFMGVTTGPYIATEALKMLVGFPGTWAINPSLPMPFINRWNHVALVRTSNVMRLYVNGISSSPYTASQSFSGSQQYGIGAENTGATIINKEFYMSSLRVSNTNRYSGTSTTSANFQYPSLPYKNDISTKFLSLQTATLIDQSASPATITANGAAVVSNFYLPSNNPGQFNPALGAAAPGIWSIDEAAYYTRNRLWPVYDPNFEDTTLLLHGYGANNAQNNTFLDSSTNNFTITRTGNTTQGTFSPFSNSGWSYYFDGTSDYITSPSSSAFSLTGDFTFECWIYPTTIAGSERGIFGIGTTDPNSNLIRIQAATSKLQFWLGGSNSGGPGTGTKTGIITCSTVLTLNRWYHIAWVRSGSATNNVKLYLNGVLDGQGTATYTLGPFACVVGGGYPGTSVETFFGYISNARYVKDGALYTSNFNPPTTPLTTTVSVGTVSLLTANSNRFVDNSVNNLTLTANGTPNVQSYSPIAPSIAYTPEVVGGSGYFDGTGDYLSVADSVPLQFGSGVFTINCWVYRSVVGAIQTIAAKGASTPTGWVFQINASDQLVFTDTSTSITTTTTIPALVWTYVSIVRSGTATNQTTLYINAVSSAVGTSATNFNQAVALNIGADRGNANVFNGYISGFEYVKGSALSISLPTIPPSTSNNPSLLANFTNAGILDSTAKNNAETVADAKISTAQSKFGGSSMFFDGTGDYLLFRSSTNFQLPGDFTIEFWMYPTSVAGEPPLFSIGTTDPSTSIIRISGTKLQFWINGSPSGITTCNTVININTWYHVAWVRSGTSATNVKLYLNGVQDGAVAAARTDNIAVAPAVVARYGSTQTTSHFSGYISDLRVTKGVARYLTNFTPPTSQLQNQ